MKSEDPNSNQTPAALPEPAALPHPLSMNDALEASEQVFDLEERSARYGEACILLAKRIPVNPVNTPLISQLVRSSTSIGANYCEANDAQTRKEFRHKISTSRKESRESKHWLRMIATDEPSLRPAARRLW